MFILNEDQNNEVYWDKYIEKLESVYNRSVSEIQKNQNSISNFVMNNRNKILSTSVKKVKWYIFPYNKHDSIIKFSDIDVKKASISFENTSKNDVFSDVNTLAKFFLNNFSIKIEGEDWKKELRNIFREAEEKTLYTGIELDQFKNNFAVTLCTNKKIPKMIVDNNKALIDMAKQFKRENSNVDKLDTAEMKIEKNEEFDPLLDIFIKISEAEEASDSFNKKINSYFNYRLYIETLQSIIGIYSDCYFQCLTDCFKLCKHALK